MVLDRSFVDSVCQARARRSSFASIHQRPVLTGTRGSGRLDFVPAYRHCGGSASGTLGTSTLTSMHSERKDRRYAATDSRRGWSNRLAKSRPCIAGSAEGDPKASYRHARSTDSGKSFLPSTSLREPLVYELKRTTNQFLGDYMGLTWQNNRLFSAFIDNSSASHVVFHAQDTP